MTRRKHEIPETGEQIPENMEAVETEPSAMMTATSAVREGAEDARETVEVVLPTLGRWVSQSVYGAFYYASFGVVFGALTVARLVPANNLAVQALRDGARAARETIEHSQAAAHAEASAPEDAAVADDASVIAA
jgi:hypothetical protein